MVFLPIIVFLVGLFIGSFLNVVITRLNTGRSVVTGRSRCDSCDRTLLWYELIPVFSFLFLRGKCRTCKAHLSFQHPFVELITGVLFVLLYSKYIVGGYFSFSAWATFVFTVVVACLLIVLTVYDLKHKIIPNKVVYPFIFISFISLFLKPMFVASGGSLLSGFLTGPLLALPFFLLWFFSHGKAMGFGDVKLALGIGWLVGGAASFSIFILSFWIGAAWSLFLISLSKKYSMRSHVPFAPFMILALLFVSVFDISLQSLFPIW